MLYTRKQTSYVQIPVGKESLSGVKMENIMEQKYTVSDSSYPEHQEVKYFADMHTTNNYTLDEDFEISCTR